MLPELTANQCRVIGVLIEKEITTPDLYPLSLNALTNGCNQKSNRDPVLNLSEAEVQNTIDELISANLVHEEYGTGSRVAKYKHRFCNTTFGDLQFSPQERAIVCLMLLRGAQTPGELRTRSNRLADFANVTEVEASLQQLQNFSLAPLVRKLEREPGKRESRYCHLFGNEEMNLTVNVSSNVQTSAIEDNNSLADRVALLEQQVADLTEQLNELLS